MARQCTPEEKKSIIADYAILQSYAAVARKHDLSPNGVKKIVLADPESAELFARKNEEITGEILDYMDKLKPQICKILQVYTKQLTNKNKLKSATVKDIAVAMGIIIDKFTANAAKPPDAAQQETLNKLDEMLKGLSGEAKKGNLDDTLK